MFADGTVNGWWFCWVGNGGGWWVCPSGGGSGGGLGLVGLMSGCSGERLVLGWCWFWWRVCAGSGGVALGLVEGWGLFGGVVGLALG